MDEESKPVEKAKFEPWYNKNYKKLIFVPVIAVIIALVILGVFYAQTGDIVKRDISLSGGVSLTIYTDNEIDIDNLDSVLSSSFADSDVSIRRLSEFGTDKQIGLLVEVSDVKESDVKPILESELGLTLQGDNYSVEEMGSTLGESFYRQMLIAVLVAFILMGIVVLIVFRSFIPSIAVISAAITDIIIGLAIIDLIGLRISSAGVAAFLLVIGYSVDTDVLLVTRVLKRRAGSVNERILASAKTGLTMTITTVAALTLGFFVSQSLILKEMFLIIVIALIVDVFSTYLTNASILKWYAHKKGR